MSETQKRILETARALFNSRGLHRVGVRDIARAAELSPGNLSYHFPTKDDLVAALVMELHDLNARTAFAALPEDLSLVGVYEIAVTAMRNMLDYRFVLLSYVDAVMASPELQRVEGALDVKRRARHDDMMQRLMRGGFVDRRRYGPRAAYLYEQGQVLSTGWLTVAMLGSARQDDRTTVLHYAKVGVALMEPHLTSRGVRQMRRILACEHDRFADELWPAPPGSAPRARTMID